MTDVVKSTFLVLGSEVTISHDGAWTINENGIYRIVSGKAKARVSMPIWVDSVIVFNNSDLVKIVIKGIHPYKKIMFEVITDHSNLQPCYRNPLLKALGDKGVLIEQGQEDSLLAFLSKHKDVPIVHGFDKVGWHTDDGVKIYVLSESLIIGGKPNKLYRYAPDTKMLMHSSLHASGSLQEWQQYVVQPIIGNHLPLMALGIAFAAPLMFIFKADGGGFNFTGPSSGGKTLSVQIAASVYGNAADPMHMPGETSIQNWHTTGNALEITALACNDRLLPMDELGLSGNRDFGKISYMVSSGSGKRTMTANREQRPSWEWRTMLFSTGEKAVAHEIEETSGNAARTGQLIRILDIPTDKPIFPLWGNVAQAKQKADTLKKNCGRFYGSAAPRYLAYVVNVANDPEALALWQERLEHNEELLATGHEDLKPEQRRAIKRFALVQCGLQMAVKAECITVDEDTIFTAVKYALELWLEEFPTVSDVEHAIERLKDFLVANPGRIADAEAEVITGIDIQAYKHDSRGFYLVPVRTMKKVCGSLYGSVKKVLHARGLLFTNNTKGKGARRPDLKLLLKNGQNVSGLAISYELLTEMKVEDYRF